MKAAENVLRHIELKCFESLEIGNLLGKSRTDIASSPDVVVMSGPGLADQCSASPCDVESVEVLPDRLTLVHWDAETATVEESMTTVYYERRARRSPRLIRSLKQ